MNPGAALIVLAKAPVAGRVKTRCTPPCTPDQAAALATAALVDTLGAAAASSASRLVIALDGAPGAWLPDGFEAIPQCEGSLGERIDHAFRAVGAPALLIGMDTPQVTSEMLDTGLALLRSGTTDSVVGPSADGGFWSLGLARADADVCTEVPMSRDDTHQQLRSSLTRHGLSCAPLPELVDVDDFATARSVAALVPGSRFAATIDSIESALDAAIVRSGR